MISTVIDNDEAVLLKRDTLSIPECKEIQPRVEITHLHGGSMGGEDEAKNGLDVGRVWIEDLDHFW
jgi:hypothetical protein